jgi:hypothetical protein
MRTRSFLLLAVLALAYLVSGTPSPVAAAQGATIQSISLDGCYIVVTFQVEDAGNYFVNFWDDGNFRAGAGGFVPAGEVASVQYLIGDLILEGAAGIGLYVEDGLGTAATTTYDSNGSYAVDSTVSTNCAAANTTSATFLGTAPGCDVLMPMTADAAVGTFVANADVYAEPGTLTSPLITLEAGKTAWVLGVDASGQYYKLVWSCSILWVKTSTMGPNYDAVWQGHPLPTGVVN